jgi:hypothetical protein
VANDGKQLEDLVAFVERTLVPQGFDVKTNQKVFNDEGVQVAEFDVEVRGKVGTTPIAWLIECRDRPGTGPAPGSWIEQLVGRRARFGFNKVTAVSTTGFAPTAVPFARLQGIELREVASLSAEAFSSWLELRGISQRIHQPILNSVRLLLRSDATAAEREAVADVLKQATGWSQFLRSSTTGLLASATAVFVSVVQKRNLFDDIVPGSEPRPVQIHALFTDSDHFLLDTSVGGVRVESILFFGTLKVVDRFVPIASSSEYRNLETGEVISQVATFEPHEVQGMRFAFEMHHLGETGETHLLLRKLDRDAP